ncbi:NADH dehydrogenase [ubiquinone] 1 beta subcomplex subunit 2, mitochondrial [Cricetulus griseus]|uniref:NADH dehydrogenase [ubiquinone] 1 beta subcomplex subunit 2, mitochondrial n=1 Tax=Cricetulus griseus TaxID=10029 RepID=G3HGK0_CRIGR|nr:NADH dehydrogenase [ubiquinone] 1 beta subcomplex subunit 2, mitochondrial [Cricetulus griseus]
MRCANLSLKDAAASVDGPVLDTSEAIFRIAFSPSAGDGVHIPPKYREFPQLTRHQVMQGEFLSSLMWFWILWHFWHDSDAVLGHFSYPDPSQWTDEELGIPPDEED